MYYIRGRILIWNYKFQHTAGLKLDLSLKLSNRKVDGKTDTAEVLSGVSAATHFMYWG